MLMSQDLLVRALEKSRQVKISVIGRTSGRTITLPVWFVRGDDVLWLLPVHGSQTHWYRNILKNPTIRIKVGSEEGTFKAQTVRSAASVRKVIQLFSDKFTGETVRRLYPGPLDVAVKVRLTGRNRN
jgi:deazaflavin-dependent oxidoreductase (nitroreductase family)